MTGSLLFVAHVCRLAKLSVCEIVLSVLHVSADSLLCVVSSVSIVLEYCVAEMATGSGLPAVDRPGVDFQVQVQVLWNAPEVYVTLDSAGAYDLNMACVTDVLGLRARRPEVAVVKVMTGHDNRSVRMLVPDEKMKRPGFPRCYAP